MKTSVWLVGLSASGKSTSGPLLATRLGYDFVDLDDRVVLETGRAVEQIFESEGEEAFRRAEARASDELLRRTGVVVATGAGWMARPDIRRVAGGCVRVWLRVSPQTAARRLRASTEVRPMLTEGNPVSDLRALLDRRSAAYAEAEVTVDTEGRTAAEVANRVVEQLARLGGIHDRQPGVRRTT